VLEGTKAICEAKGAICHNLFIDVANPDSIVEFANILTDIGARDERDTGRADAPLKPAEDALLLDTGDLTIGDAVQAAIALVESRLRKS
jgi:cytidylate kinase